MIAFYATGEGQTNPPGVDGKLAVAPLPQPVGAVNVTIGGKPAVIRYAGGAPGQVAGLMQINAVVPPDIAGVAPVPILLSIGGVSSQKNVTVAVAGN